LCLMFCPGLTWDLDRPTMPSSSWHFRYTTMPSLLMEMGISLTFFPGLSSNYGPSNLHLLSNWDDRTKPLCLTLCEFNLGIRLSKALLESHQWGQVL
jgi:hypothetical protein